MSEHDSPKPVCWRREWNGDDSDLGISIHADSEDELDAGPWEPLYSAAALSGLAAEVEKMRAERDAALSKLEVADSVIHKKVAVPVAERFVLEHESAEAQRDALALDAAKWENAATLERTLKESAEARVLEVERDAKRYQWLRDRLRGVDFSYGEDRDCVLTFDWPVSCRLSANLDATIDAARALKERDDTEGKA